METPPRRSCSRSAPDGCTPPEPVDDDPKPLMSPPSKSPSRSAPPFEFDESFLPALDPVPEIETRPALAVAAPTSSRVVMGGMRSNSAADKTGPASNTAQNSTARCCSSRCSDCLCVAIAALHVSPCAGNLTASFNKAVVATPFTAFGACGSWTTTFRVLIMSSSEKTMCGSPSSFVFVSSATSPNSPNTHAAVAMSCGCYTKKGQSRVGRVLDDGLDNSHRNRSEQSQAR